MSGTVLIQFKQGGNAASEGSSSLWDEELFLYSGKLCYDNLADKLLFNVVQIYIA
jgi:hypothetical protein